MRLDETLTIVEEVNGGLKVGNPVGTNAHPFFRTPCRLRTDSVLPVHDPSQNSTPTSRNTVSDEPGFVRARMPCAFERLYFSVFSSKALYVTPSL